MVNFVLSLNKPLRVQKKLPQTFFAQKTCLPKILLGPISLIKNILALVGILLKNYSLKE